MMKKRRFVLIALLLLLASFFQSFAHAADPNLYACWKFDESSGSTAHDSAGSHDGAVYGSTWTSDSKFGNALSFNDNDHVFIANIGIINNWTVCFWAKSNDNTGAVYFPIGFFDPISGVAMGGTSSIVTQHIALCVGNNSLKSSTVIEPGTWYHVAVTKNATTYSLYVNGVCEVTGALSDIDLTNFMVGFRPDGQGFFEGNIDDVGVWNCALAAGDIDDPSPGTINHARLYGISESGYGIAMNPSPSHMQINVKVNTALSWTAGERAADVNGHKLYFGNNFNDVNAGTADYIMLTEPNYSPADLYYGTDYYWRVDEVNGPGTWRGIVWKFTTTDSNCIGDIDGNGKLDYKDIFILCSHWLGAPEESEPNSDLNLDGKIDFADFSMMAEYWDKNVWVVYPGYEAAVGYPVCAYDGNLICEGYLGTGIQLFNGISYSYGTKPNYVNIQQAWPLTRSFNAGVLLQTAHNSTAVLEYAASPDSGNFTVVTLPNCTYNYVTQLQRSAVDCGEINDIDIGNIAQWKFDETGDTSGLDSVIDSSGNNNHLTPGAPVVSIDGARPATMNSAIDFDGSNQYMSVSGAGLEPAGDFTVCFWMNLNDVSQGSQTIIVQGTSGGRCIEAQGSKLRVFLDQDGAADACVLSDDGYLSAEEWDFYSIVYTASTDSISIYKNGTKSSISNITKGNGALVNYNSNDFYIGGSPDGNLMNGQLDNVIVFNRALTGNQIKILYSGRPDGSGTGTQDLNRLRRVVFFFNYGADAQSNAWFSRDDCLTWTRMWTANARSISHFHGGIFEPSAGDKGRLYVFTGDSDVNSSILTCDDINDLITNRETWYNRWALGAGQRTDWTPDSNYVLGWNDQKWRTVDIVSDGKYGYWVPDTSAAVDIALYKVTHSNKMVTKIAAHPEVKGAGWIGLCTNAGDVTFLTIPAPLSDNTFDSGTDEFVHLYKIKNDSVRELNKWRFSAYNPFVYPVIAPGRQSFTPIWLSELNDIIYIYGRNMEAFDISSLGSYNYPFLAKAGSINRIYTDFTISPITNPVVNGTFDDNFNSWITAGSWSIDSEVTEGGHAYSAKCEVADGFPYLKQNILVDYLPVNSFVTVRVKIRVASGANSGFTPAIVLGLDDNGTEPVYIQLANSASPTALADDNWHEFWTSAFLRHGIKYITVVLYTNSSEGATGTVYFSDVRIESGRAFGYQHF